MRKKIAFVATYLPRKCGIATFTYDLLQSVRSDETQCSVIAIDDGDESYCYPPEIVFRIKQGNPEDYTAAGRFLNLEKFDMVFIQHEFGIYGGNDGGFILELMKQIQVPVAVTLHTILDEPSDEQLRIIREISMYSSRLIVMSQLGKKMLEEIYGIPAGKITVIEHGIPDPSEFQVGDFKSRIGIQDKNVLMTFGLLSQSKGIETVIHALPAIIRQHPDTIYLVVGATHPHVLKKENESYRNYLKSLIALYNIQKHVLFIDRFLTQPELFGFLSASDIYIVPYLSQKQITSGTLVYAMATENAVVSTPFWHAQEALADERGFFFGFRDYMTLANHVDSLLKDRTLLKKYQKKATVYARQYNWKNIGEGYLSLVHPSRPLHVMRRNKIKLNEAASPT